MEHLKADTLYGVMQMNPRHGFLLGSRIADIEPGRRRAYLRRFYHQLKDRSRQIKVKVRRKLLNHRVAT